MCDIDITHIYTNIYYIFIMCVYIYVYIYTYYVCVDRESTPN